MFCKKTYAYPSKTVTKPVLKTCEVYVNFYENVEANTQMLAIHLYTIR